MAYYRLYFFDGDGHIQRFQELQAERDADAIGAARQYRGRHSLELWSGSRLVRTLKPVEPAPAPQPSTPPSFLNLAEASRPRGQGEAG
jgi:hypothetical protein